MMRRIGNGANTTIWGTAWLTSNGSGKIITSRPIYSSFPNMLGDLIDWNRGAWDLVVINQHMRACDASRILEVPIGYEKSPDCFYWSLSKHGNFKVRYCYYHILESAKSSDTSKSGKANFLSSSEWKWIWGLQLPPKSGAFLWRACNDILPVKVALVNRKLGGDRYVARYVDYASRPRPTHFLNAR